MVFGLPTLLVLLILAAWGVQGLSQRVGEQQAVWLQQSILRSAVQCYSIEGSFPTTAQGVAYLSERYGLHIDHRHYVVYYESMGANMLPQVRVLIVADNSQQQAIQEQLGVTPPSFNPAGTGQ